MELPALGLTLVMVTNGNCHRRLLPFADHHGVHFVIEGVIVVLRYALIAGGRLEDVIVLLRHAYLSSQRDT
jgi:hypothetical protein